MNNLVEGRDLVEGREGEPAGEWSFAHLQERVREIYEAHDEECEYGPDTILAKLLGNTLTLKRTLRGDSPDIKLIDRSLTNVFIWTATLANAAGLNLQNLLEQKYGEGCPHCKQMPCLLAQGQECKPQVNPLEIQKIPIIIPNSIQQWQHYLAGLFPNNYFDGHVVDRMRNVCQRIFDEAGELVASSYRDIEQEVREFSFQDEMKPWESEMSDILAWSFALATGLNKWTGEYSIESSLREKYSHGCPYCKSSTCICPKAKTFLEEIRASETTP